LRISPRALQIIEILKPSCLLELPQGYPKGKARDHHFCKTHKGAPTNRAGTPDGVDLERSGGLAKPLSARFFAEKSAKNSRKFEFFALSRFSANVRPRRRDRSPVEQLLTDGNLPYGTQRQPHKKRPEPRAAFCRALTTVGKLCAVVAIAAIKTACRSAFFSNGTCVKSSSQAVRGAASANA
jgi:hypothetical protein